MRFQFIQHRIFENYTVKLLAIRPVELLCHNAWNNIEYTKWTRQYNGLSDMKLPNIKNEEGLVQEGAYCID